VMREQASEATRRLRLAECVLDLQARELRTADDRPVDIRPKTLDVLLFLGEHAGRVVDKATLMDRVWPGVVVGDDSLTQTVVEIRRALGDREHQILSTVARRGYRLQPSEPSAPTFAPSLSVAVLPIAHDAADLEGARWSALLTSELTSRAGVSLPDSKVVARETVAAMGAALSDPRVAARQLGVQQVVCGDLRATADGWSVVLTVVEGLSGTRRWSHRFALPRTGLPDLIGQLASQAARAVLVEMHRTAATIAAERPPSERSAGDRALQGWASAYEGLSPANLEWAEQFFEQAVEKEPTLLWALGGVTCVNNWRAHLCWTRDAERTRQRVRHAAWRSSSWGVSTSALPRSTPREG